MGWLLLLSASLAALTFTTHGQLYGNGVVLPNDPYIYIGNNLTLTCNLTKYNTDYDSRYLTFSRKNDESIPRDFINITSTRSILLRYPIRSPDDGGNYICKLNRTSGRPEIIGNQVVQVEYEPRPVTEIECRVYNWENMTCTWELGVQYVHPDSIAVDLIWTTSGSQFDCPHQTRTSCSWWAVDDGDTFIRDMVYTMGVAVQDLISNLPPALPKIFKIDTMRIVEPMPVSALTATQNSSCVTLSWQHKKVRADRISNPDLVYRVGFMSQWDTQWETKLVGNLMSVVLCELRPATVYRFNVSCRPRMRGAETGFWSRHSVIDASTDEDVPSVAPEIEVGSYMEQPCHQHYCKKVVVYWKPLDMVGTGGEIIRYRLDYRNVEKVPGIWESLSVAGNSHEATLLLVAGDDYRIQLRAATRVGVAEIFTQIMIPARSKKPPMPQFIVEAETVSNGSLVTLTWDDPRQWTTPHWRNLTSYTVYWCQGYPVSQSCKAAVQWATVPVTTTSHTLPLAEFETYLFGVAVNAATWAGQAISSGLAWSQCTYRKHHQPDVAPTNVRFSPYQPSGGLRIEWERLTCRNTYAYIQRYLVNVCRCPSGSNCTGDVTTYPVDGRGSQLLVPELTAGRRYKLWVTAAASAGLGPDSGALYGLVIDRRLNAGEISGIVIGAMFVVIIFTFGIILCTRRLFRTLKRRYFEPIPVEMPNTLPPLPPIPMPPPQSSLSSSSETIYEKIDGPPSPCSSTESTTGVDTPLINSKWRLTNIKYHFYGKWKEQRASSDSGRGSLSHSADTLLMTLHPPHGKKSKKSKIKHKSESDSGVIIDNRGHAVCCFTNSESNWADRKSLNTGDVNPYSCIDIVNKLNTTSEQLKRKTVPVDLRSDGCDNSGATDIPYSTYSNGSTMSLPPVSDSCFLSQSMTSRTKSADDQLQFEENNLDLMVEASAGIASDVYSADDSTRNRTAEESTINLYENRDTVTSYVQVVNMETCDLVQKSAPKITIPKCDCCCHNDVMPVAVGDGYVKQEVIFDRANHKCGCEFDQKQRDKEALKPEMTCLGADLVMVVTRPVSQVMGLPPHFYGSMSLMDADPSNTTEL